jgi:putative membrane protein
MQEPIVQTAPRRRTIVPGAACLALFVLGLSGAARAQTPSNTDRAFLSWAIQIEIQQQDMGRIAVRRAQTPAVRGLGNYLIERHRQAQQRLQAVAAQLRAPLSDKLSAAHMRVQARYASISSVSFDAAFVRHEAGDYRYFLAHFEAAANSGSGPVRDYATKEISHLKEDESKITALAGPA